MGEDDELAVAAAVRSVEGDEAIVGPVVVKRYQRVGGRVVAAVEFVSARTGALRRGFAGVVFRDGLWRPSGGWSSNAVHEAAPDDIWLNSGGWSNAAWTTHGGWVADPSATQFRAVDRVGRVEQDTISDGIAILIWEGGLDREARGELVAADGTVLRSGLVL